MVDRAASVGLGDTNNSIDNELPKVLIKPLPFIYSLFFYFIHELQIFPFRLQYLNFKKDISLAFYYFMNFQRKDVKAHYLE